jgi:hypothetical protein
MNLLRSFCSYVNLKETQTKFTKILDNFKFNTVEKVYNLDYYLLEFRLEASTLISAQQSQSCGDYYESFPLHL